VQNRSRHFSPAVRANVRIAESDFNPHPNKGGSDQTPCIYLLHNFLNLIFFKLLIMTLWSNNYHT